MGIILKWAIKKHKKELLEFISYLKTMDNESIGMLVALVAHVRHNIDEGNNFLDPIVYYNQNSGINTLLIGSIKILQKRKEFITASASMVWLHTFRAASRIELRGLGQNLWKELERGFPYIDDAVENARLMGSNLNIEDSTCFPIGFTPNR